MGGSKSSISQKLTNMTVNKSDLEVLNQQANSFVSNSVTTSAATCAASSSSQIENTMGNIVVAGKGNKAKIGIDSTQDTQLSLQCIQQSVQQTNVSNQLIRRTLFA